MRTSIVSISALALATVVSAGADIIDNTAVAEVITKAGTKFSGTYKVTSVANGKSMYFSRPTSDSTTDLILGDDQTIELEWLSGMHESSQKGTFSGVRLSGNPLGPLKCASAQWQDTSGSNGHNWAAASYACTIGSKASSTEDMNPSKQLWSFVPCGSSSSSASDDDDDDDSSSTKKKATSNAKVQQLAEVSSSSSSSTSSSKSSSSSSSSSSTVCKYNQQESYINMDKAGVYEACKDKIAKFEKRHPELAPFKKPNSKRSLHARRAATMRRSLAVRTTQQYCIVAQDHLSDQTATAIIASTVKTPFSGQDYTGLRLAEYKGASSASENMLWTVTKA